MKTKYNIFLIAFLLSANVFSQTNLNNYKYVIVPNKYDFLKDNDQYQLNSLTEFLFNKYGFQALMEGTKYPEDLIRNRCLALKSDLIKDSSLFKTKLAVELKDCNDVIVYTSEMGESREKEYNTAYNISLRDAFKSFEALNYKYEPSANIASQTTYNTNANNSVETEIEQLKAEIESLKNEKEAVVVGAIIPVVEAPAKVVPVENVSSEVKTVKESKDVLYAQPIDNGFQLVDSTPKVLYKIKKTGVTDVFLVENKSATLYKKGNDWVLEYYENNVLKQEILNIKF